MIEHIPDLPDGCIGMTAVGQFTIDDFASVIAPDVDEVVQRHERLRLILELGDRFEGSVRAPGANSPRNCVTSASTAGP